MRARGHRLWSLCGSPETVSYHASCETTKSQVLKMSSHLVTDLKVVLTLARKAVKRTVLVINSIENKGLLDQADLTTEILAGATSQHLRSALPAPETPSYVLLEDPSYGAIRTQFARLPVMRRGLMGHIPQIQTFPIPKAIQALCSFANGDELLLPLFCAVSVIPSTVYPPTPRNDPRPPQETAIQKDLTISSSLKIDRLIRTTFPLPSAGPG